jgi:predicted nucleotidyltransferase
MNLHVVLAPFIGSLERARIEYAIIGGYAAAAWGELRATRDIDLLCSVKDLDLVKSALKASGVGFEHRMGDFEDPISDVIRIDVGTAEDLYQIDVLAGIKGAPAGLLQRSRTVQIENLALKVASPEDMIILKLLGGSALDIEDARGILRIQDRSINRSLLNQICPDLLKGALADLMVEAGG